MSKENKQFFDGVLLGALVVGLVLVTIITYILFQNAPEVGEGTVFIERTFNVEPSDNLDLLTDELGQSIVIEDMTYTIEVSAFDKSTELTYRTLKDENDLLYPSLWAKEGQQLLYKPTVDIFTASGEQNMTIINIYSDHELILQTIDGVLLSYDLISGIIQPWKMN